MCVLYLFGMYSSRNNKHTGHTKSFVFDGVLCNWQILSSDRFATLCHYFLFAFGHFVFLSLSLTFSSFSLYFSFYQLLWQHLVWQTIMSQGLIADKPCSTRSHIGRVYNLNICLIMVGCHIFHVISIVHIPRIDFGRKEKRNEAKNKEEILTKWRSAAELPYPWPERMHWWYKTQPTVSKWSNDYDYFRMKMVNSRCACGGTMRISFHFIPWIDSCVDALWGFDNQKKKKRRRAYTYVAREIQFWLLLLFFFQPNLHCVIGWSEACVFIVRLSYCGNRFLKYGTHILSIDKRPLTIGWYVSVLCILHMTYFEFSNLSVLPEHKNQILFNAWPLTCPMLVITKKRGKTSNRHIYLLLTRERWTRKDEKKGKMIEYELKHQ